MRRLRETLMAYVTVWGAGVDTYSPRIREAVARLRRHRSTTTGGPWPWPASMPRPPRKRSRRSRPGTRTPRRPSDTGSGPSTGQALRLRRQVRDAVTPLLRGSRALLATGGSVTRRAELLRIARRSNRPAVTPTPGGYGARPPAYGPPGTCPASPAEPDIAGPHLVLGRLRRFPSM